MFFYLLFGPSTILLLIMLIDLRRTSKHDKVLYGFCQLRRDIIKLIYDEHSQISKSDYKALRALLEATNVTIHEFRHFKVTMFNLRWFIDWVKKYKKNATQIDNLSTSHKTINKLKDKYAIAMIKAFFAYTPLIKSQFIVMLVLAILQFLLKLGIKSLGIQSLQTYLSWLKDEISTHSNHSPQHV